MGSGAHIKAPILHYHLFEGRKIAIGEARDRVIKVIYAKLGRYYKDNYNKITMRLEYDEEVDAAYIYLEYPLENGISKKTIELNDNIIIDFDKDGKLIGVEILNASNVLNKESLVEAQPA